MTGTAQTEAAELHEIYKLGVVSIPTNKPMIRADQSDLIYKTEEAKYIAVVDDVAERYEKGQPVLIGTTSVERSEYLSRQFIKRRIPHNVLNAKYHEQEAGIIAEAGRRGAITVATNMAGRGTDIVLGGNVDFLADKRLREQGLDPVETPDEYEAAWHELLPPESRTRPRRRPRKSSPRAGCTCWAPSGTSRAASTTSCAAARAARATRASRGSTCRWPTS